jgi:hypothetical protein
MYGGFDRRFCMPRRDRLRHTSPHEDVVKRSRGGQGCGSHATSPAPTAAEPSA